MNKYFNVQIEFDRHVINERIDYAIQQGQKGYICLIESNNLSEANLNSSFYNVVNGAIINLCDGSVVALLLSIIHRKKLISYTGSEIFLDTIKSQKYTHYFLGNKQDILDGLKPVLVELDKRISDAIFTELPFRDVEQFDYMAIAKEINCVKPNCIWVSLGAPKQEIFMSKLLPYIEHGILFGVGAVFNFYSKSSSIKRAPLWMRRYKLEWLHRILKEPRKSIPRYWRFIKLTPSLIQKELNIRHYQ